MQKLDMRLLFWKHFSKRTMLLAFYYSLYLKFEGKSYWEKKKKSRQGKTMLMKTWIRKNKFPDPRKEKFSIVPPILEILSELLKPHRIIIISNDSDFQIHLKHQSNECFINNYFAEGLEAWKTNIDIQPFFNHYKAVTYMCAYFSKAENETSEAIKQAAKEAHLLGKTNSENIRTVARPYFMKRESLVQKAVYLVISELWLRKTFPKVIFLNSNIP